MTNLVLYCWAGADPHPGEDEPVLVLPDWLGPREREQIEQFTGGRIVQVPDSGRVLVSRADGEGGWQDLGYVYNFEIRQADRLQTAVDLSLAQVMRRYEQAVQFDVPIETMRGLLHWFTDLPSDWYERWSRHMLNGPAALMAGGWRRSWVVWSIPAMLGLRLRADQFERMFDDQIVEQYRRGLANGTMFAPAHPLEQLQRLAAQRQAKWALAWQQAFDWAAVHGMPIAQPGEAGTVSTEVVDTVLQRSWESTDG